jgi:hypothetical protein
VSGRDALDTRPAIEPALLSERDAAVFLAVSPRLLREIVRRGEVPVIRIPGAWRSVCSVEALRAVARTFVPRAGASDGSPADRRFEALGICLPCRGVEHGEGLSNSQVIAADRRPL